jgi:cytochrome c6
MSKSWVGKLVIGAAGLAVLCLLGAPVQGQGSGEKVYKAKCAMCHAADGSGNTPTGKALKAESLCSDAAKKQSDAEMTAIIVKGKNKMPAYDKKLTEAEIKEVIAYIRTLCKK